MSEVQDYSKPEEVELSPDDAPDKKSEFIVPEANPLDEVAEPVHTGQGALFLDSDDSSDDFSDAVGPNQLRNMEPQVISEDTEEVTISLASAVSQEESNETPELPDIPDESSDMMVDSTPEIPDIPVDVPNEVQDETPVVPDIPQDADIESQNETPEVPDIPLDTDDSTGGY